MGLIDIQKGVQIIQQTGQTEQLSLMIISTMSFKKVLIPVFLMIILVSVVSAQSIIPYITANLERRMNQWTRTYDYFTSLNQSDKNITATNATFDNLLVKNPPVRCPTGTYMVYSNMTTAICVSAMRITGENVTGFYNFSDNMAVNDTLYVYDGRVGIGTASPAVGLHLGSTATSHSLSDATDAIISGKLEVEGEAYYDFKLHVYHLFEVVRSSGRATHSLYAGTSQEPTYGLDTVTKQLVLTTSDLVAKGFDHGSQTNPTLFIQSATSPDTNNTQWLSLAHDQTNGIFGLGSGAYTFPDGNVGIGTASPEAKLDVKEIITDVTTANTLSKINLTLNTTANIGASQTALDIDFNVITARDIHKPLKGINVDMNTENTDPASHIEAAYGIYIDVVSDASSDNNAYGLFVKNVSGGTGNLYGIYSNASENKIENKLIVGNLETSEDIELARSTVQNTTGKKIVWGRTEGPFIASYKTGTDSDQQAIVIYDHESASGGNAALFNTIFRDGNVGIGITSPNYKLDVMGDVNASNYYINGSSIFEILDNGTILRTDNMSDIRETAWDFANNDTFVLDNDTIIRSNFNGTLGAYYLYPNGTNPISLNHLVNKEFVELAVSGLTLDYFFTNVTSDIAGYYVLNNTERSAPQSIVESVSLSSGNNQSVFNFSTTAGLPFIFLSEGIYDAHIHLDKTGGAAQIIHPRWELHKRNSSGDFLITISETSNVEITGTNQIFNLHAVFNDDVPIVSTDRLVIKLFVDITGGGSSTVRLYMEGTTDSHFTFRTPSSVLQEIFIRRDGANELTGNWNVGGFDIVNIGNISADTLLGKWNGSVKYSLETDAFKVENGTALPFSNFQIENVSNDTVGYSELFNFMGDNITSANSSSNVKEYGGNVTGTYDALILNPCANTEILKYDTTGKWVCGADNTGGAPDTTDYWNVENDTRNVCGMNSTNITCIGGKLVINESFLTAETDPVASIYVINRTLDEIADESNSSLINHIDNANASQTTYIDLLNSTQQAWIETYYVTGAHTTDTFINNCTDDLSCDPIFYDSEFDDVVINRTDDEIGDLANSSLLNHISNNNDTVTASLDLKNESLYDLSQFNDDLTHTVDTDTRAKTDNDILYNDSDTHYFNKTSFGEEFNQTFTGDENITVAKSGNDFTFHFVTSILLTYFKTIFERTSTAWNLANNDTSATLTQLSSNITRGDLITPANITWAGEYGNVTIISELDNDANYLINDTSGDTNMSIGNFSITQYNSSCVGFKFSTGGGLFSCT